MNSFLMKKPTHLDEDETAQMVDVSSKSETRRMATAEGRIFVEPETLKALATGNGPKGDVFSTARIAAIMAAKRTDELIPLCHSLGLEAVSVDFEIEQKAIRVTAIVSVTGRTGVEMEAMTAVSVALLTLYDMGKALDKTMTIGGIRLLSKEGGKSGNWNAET